MTQSNAIIRREFFYPLLVILASVLPLSAQVLRGTVVQKDTKAPLAAVNVFLKDTKYGTITDSLGYFEIKGLPFGGYVLEVRRVGFKTNTYVLAVEGDEPVTLKVELEEEPVMVEGVEVSGDAEKAHRLSTVGKTIITSEQIKRTGTKSLSTFLKSRYPGLFPSYTRRAYERLQFVLYVNGTLVQYTADVIDSMIDVEQVDYVEVYRSFGLNSTPNRGSNERVIHIHTKIPELRH
jgi:outer membrane receptor for ferrienterochelin and colicins